MDHWTRWTTFTIFYGCTTQTRLPTWDRIEWAWWISLSDIDDIHLLIWCYGHFQIYTLNSS